VVAGNWPRMAGQELPTSVDKQRRRLLILCDDQGMRRELEKIFSDLDLTASEICDQVPVLVRRVEPDVVLLDFGAARAPAGAAQSLALLRDIVKLSPDTRIIAMTEYNARELAVAAVGLGAADFYHKPLDAGVLSIVVRRAFRIRELEEENWRLREQTGSMALEGIIGVSDTMRSLCRAIEKVAPTNATVLLLGDSGTGKELLARALHRLSTRSHQPFVAINCAAIPDTLLESELFGYEKGAFTGANKRTLGRLESADHGTVFLDEIGEIPASLQAKLLRFLQERSVERIGGRTPIPLDLRIICATNRNLEAQIGSGGFRDDLYYRISEPCACRRCASARAIVSCWRSSCCRKWPSASASRRAGLRPMRSAPSRSTPGRATCGSWKIASRARSSWPRAPWSPPATWACRTRPRILST
jgi:two-component system NtrC family response regulator